MLHYNPQRVAFSGSGAAVSKKYFSWFVWCVVLIFCLSALITLGLLGLALVGLVLIPFVVMDWCRPTNLQLSGSGMRIHWLHPTMSLTSPWFTWNLVQSVRYSDAKLLGVDSGKCFDITLDTSELPPWEKFLFESVCIPMTQSFENDRLTIRLSEAGFFQEADQEILRSVLRKYIPADHLSDELIAREEFGEIPSYTALWFSNLDNSSGAELRPLPVGTMLADGRYEAVSRLGSGGQAVVYDALCHKRSTNQADETISEKCVLKEFVLPVRGGMEIKKRALENIHREANLLKTLDHPNIVKYQDLFVEGPRAYLVMEKIEGATLRRYVEEHGPMDSSRVIQVAAQMCLLLEFMHNQLPPILHRDFTPENLMFTEDGQVTLIDFNVAYRLESTSTKSVVGKHSYVPPEQFRGKPTAKSDIYALGGTLFFLLTGADPEPITSSDPQKKGADVNPKLAKIVAQCTEPDADRRSDLDGLINALLELAPT